MPKVKVNNLQLNYQEEGSGEPLLLIPYLSADHACYAFQVAEYAKHFTCISLDLRGTGESDKSEGPYSTETLADDVAAFLKAKGISKAHVFGMSLGAAVGMWLAAKHPEQVQSLSLHSSWPKSDLFVKRVVEGWQATAKGLGSVTEMVIHSIFPWCFTPEMYSSKPDYVESLEGFVRSRPAQSVDSFLQQSSAVLGHDVEARLSKIQAPTQITFGSSDQVTSTRFANTLRSGIRNSDVLVFDGCSHAALYERVQEFNGKTLPFLKSHSGSRA